MLDVTINANYKSDINIDISVELLLMDELLNTSAVVNAGNIKD